MNGSIFVSGHLHEKFHMKLFGHMNQQQAHIVVSKHTSNKKNNILTAYKLEYPTYKVKYEDSLY